MIAENELLREFARDGFAVLGVGLKPARMQAAQSDALQNGLPQSQLDSVRVEYMPMFNAKILAQKNIFRYNFSIRQVRTCANWLREKRHLLAFRQSSSK